MSLIPCYIARVVMDERHDRQTVAIRAYDDDRGLSMVIGQHEAMAIERALHDEHFPRPLTHDLLLDIIESLEGSLDEVAIMHEDGGTYFAELHISLEDGEIVAVDCRPSDGLALIARAPDAGLVVEEELLE